MDEYGKGETELVPVERSLWFTDHHGGEPSPRVAERIEEASRFRAAFPWQRSALADVEGFLDDGAAVRLDQLTASLQLPGPGGRRVLLVLVLTRP